MPVFVYVAVIFLILLMVGIFWFMQTGSGHRPGFDFRSLFDRGSSSADDLFIVSGIRQLERISDKGKWLLFLAIFLLLIEFFIFLSYMLENTGFNSLLTPSQHVSQLGALVFFFLCICTILVAIRLVNASKDLVSSDSLLFGKSFLEQKIHELNPEQKKQFSLFLSERNENMQAVYGLGLVLASAAVTLLLVWLAAWLMQAFH